jgi:hypothetical protein
VGKLVREHRVELRGGQAHQRGGWQENKRPQPANHTRTVSSTRGDDLHGPMQSHSRRQDRDPLAQAVVGDGHVSPQGADFEAAGDEAQGQEKHAKRPHREHPGLEPYQQRVGTGGPELRVRRELMLSTGEDGERHGRGRRAADGRDLQA